MSFPISDVKRRVVYSGSAGVGPYSFSFEILTATDIDVYKNSTLLTLTTDYTVAISPDGTGSVTLVAAATGSDNITLVGARAIERSTDFVTGGDLFANTLNEELDSVVIFAQQVDEKADRGLKAPITDPTDINMELPIKTSRRGKVLAFDEVSGDPVAGPDLSAVETVIQQSANINTVANNIGSVNTVAGNTANINTVAGISGNVTTVAGIQANVTTVAGISSDVTAVAGNATNITAVANNATNINAVNANEANINAVNANEANINTVAGISADVTTVAGIAADIPAAAAIDATDLAAVAGIAPDVTTVAGIAANVTTVANNDANITAVAGDATNINTVATNISNVNAVGSNISNVNAVAGNATNINAVAANASNINQVASDTVAINAASANAASAAASATAASGSATNAANSAALANAVSLANEPVRHSVRPSLLLDFANVKALDPRITFARASTARFYDGKTVAKAEENLLLQSAALNETAWAKTNTTVTANNAVAPDGTTTAETLLATDANATTLQTVTTVAGDYTFSVFLRRVSGTGNVDISAHSGGTWVTQSITSSWARYTVTQTLTAGSRTPGIRIVVDTDSIEVWGAQLEQRSAATAYTPTTTQPITNYVPVLQSAANNVARFDHNPVTGESLGLLIEEQRTNLLTRSEEFNDAIWGKTRASITINTVVAPDGTLTGDKLVEDTTANNSHLVQQLQTLVANTVYTLSVYAKAGERTRFQLGTAGTANWVAPAFVTFDLSAGTVAAGTGTITPVGNGWYRCSITATFGSSNASSGMAVVLVSSGTTTTYTGNGFNGIYIWGAQLE